MLQLPETKQAAWCCGSEHAAPLDLAYTCMSKHVQRYPKKVSGTAQPYSRPSSLRTTLSLLHTCRLQPSAIVTDENCAACDFNRPGKTCLRKMDWVWRGEHFASNVAEYNSIKNQLASEVVPPAGPDQPAK